MTEGRFYTTPNGTTGRACRHPLHERGMVAYLETATGEIIAVFPSTVRRATPNEVQSWKGGKPGTREGRAMSKPTKTTPQKKRKLARVVIGGGTGSTQRPMYPLTARFASRISKAFPRTMKPVPSAARVRHANCLTLPECLTLRPKMAPGLDVRRFSCLTLMPYYSPVNRGLIERVRQLDKNETEQYRRGIRGSRGDRVLNASNCLTLLKPDPNSPAHPAHQKGPTP